MHRHMERLRIECLRCGTERTIALQGARGDAGECPRCEYVGWALSAELDEPARRALRERPLDRRVHAFA